MLTVSVKQNIRLAWASLLSTRKLPYGHLHSLAAIQGVIGSIPDS